LFLAKFAAKFVLAPVKRRYLSEHWLGVMVRLLPFLRLLRVLRILRATRTLPVFRLLVFGGKGSSGSSDALVLLRRHLLGQLVAASAMVVLIGATAGFLMESDASGSQIEDFGDALWWSAALATAVGSELYPVTAGGRVLGFLHMIYAVGNFSYFIGATASVLVEADACQAPAGPEDVNPELRERELEALRSILKKAEGP
jgi:voltage-gated potassium channel